MMYFSILTLLAFTATIFGNLTDILKPDRLEDQRIEMIIHIITSNFKDNGWNTVLCAGNLPDAFFYKIQHIPYAFVITNLNDEDHYVEDIVEYHSNVIVISCQDFEEFEEIMQNLVFSPYWHPLANIILYYHKEENRGTLAKIFFALWYYKAVNSIIIQYNDMQRTLLVSDYTPYVNENYTVQPDNKFGCWTERDLGMPVSGFKEGLVCVEKCHNVSVHSKLRATHLGTCVGYNTKSVSYSASKDIRSLNLFQDRTKNFFGFALRAYMTEVSPFIKIDEHKNGSYTLHARDGMIWNTMAKLMNFSIDLSPSVATMKKQFSFELSIEQIFSFVRRKGDLFLLPIYQFDIVVVELDFTFPLKGSGICIVAARAGFETTLFAMGNLDGNYNQLLLFCTCFLCIWGTFSIYKATENGRITLDQIGKDFMNACRNVLLLDLCNPPKFESFRIFLSISVWSFFVLHFATQATIISFFTAAKRGKEVDTFEDVVEKGYPIEAMASPDMILPETEERFLIMNSRLVSQQDMFGCIRRMASDTRRFCLVDCSVGHYLKRNNLNARGEQYLHVAEKDRIHSHYLSMILPKHSALTDRFNSYMIRLFESGLISKWEQYRYNDIKDEATTNSLDMKDLGGIFQMYFFYLAVTIITFLLELFIHRFIRLVKYFKSSKR